MSFIFEVKSRESKIPVPSHLHGPVNVVWVFGQDSFQTLSFHKYDILRIPSGAQKRSV